MLRAVPIVTLLAALAPAQTAPASPAADEFVQRYCIDCHGGDLVKGDLDLTQPPPDLAADLWRWSRMRERVLAGEMPPPDNDAPDAAERTSFGARVATLSRDRVGELPLDPGRVTVRRLSRMHWQNCVQDLFGVRADTSGFPADDLGYGFDSIGDALTFSTLHLEKYVAAARAVAEQVFTGEDPEHPAVRRFEAEDMAVVDGHGVRMGSELASMTTRATIEQVVQLPRDGAYRLEIGARAQQAGDEPARMRLAVDGREVETFDVPERELRTFELDLEIAGGQHPIALSFVNDYYDPQNPDEQRRDRNLHIDALIVEGPVDPLVVPAEQQWLHAAATGRSDEAKLKRQLDALLPRLWRRPVAAAESRRLVQAGQQLLRAGEPLVAAQRYVLTAALASPHFLFRLEPQRGGSAPADLDGTALASRLSFFLWSSAPDAELLQRGRRRVLEDPGLLAVEVDRLLADARAERLATDFAAQWLELRALDERTPDPARYPGFDALRGSMRRESELLFAAVLRERRDVRELLDCDFTFVDAALAAFYGLPFDGAASGFERVALAGDFRRRGGLLGHASVHAVTSGPTRTSPVKRGKWILENLLDQAPPPPPPGNDSFAAEAAIDSSASLREQMAQHREKRSCAVCHVRMDALGLALERYDVLGRFRAEDAGGPIDCSGELPTGERIDGLAGLKRVLAADPAFVHTVAHKLFVYAVGRDLRPVDRLRIDVAVRELLAGGTVTLRDLILVVVRDPAFRMRGGV